ncbi:hypothetical protein CC77DRAFT_1022400 [Alternaria alternata]|uniref:Uncharacterized protein n=1 Tax=Alternaria alternata TaxID=5599 RepID=A0A177DEI5_ALTAL|nr:hypothetical protein CC77DRAFT_1022400 [Alternaria alternata]KAH6858460.1 hypothetical protein B0T12DRAFT_160181 [Alternaria alternata]OAG18163.1 hypothetical protein CC77DRAFT_1022400 [Alternaria alternata]
MQGSCVLLAQRLELSHRLGYRLRPQSCPHHVHRQITRPKIPLLDQFARSCDADQPPSNYVATRSQHAIGLYAQ